MECSVFNSFVRLVSEVEGNLISKIERYLSIVGFLLK